MGILVALMGGVGAYVAASGSGGGGSANASPTATPEPTTTVVVATQDINLGDRITGDMVTTKTMKVSERDQIGPGTFTSVDQVVGKVAGGKISANQPLIASSDFLNNGSITSGKDIAGAIASGYEAVSIELDQVNGVGALIVPGDRINIILSVYVDQLGLDNPGKLYHVTIPGAQAVTTKTVIQNRKVLLTLLPPPAAEATNGANAGGSPTPQSIPTVPIVYNDGRHMIAIVEVKPDEAEIIRWAQRAEKLDPQNYITLGVTLRSDKDNSLPDAVTPGITFKMLVDKYGVLPPDGRAIIPPDIARQLQW